MRDSVKPAPDLKDARITWSPRLNFSYLEKFWVLSSKHRAQLGPHSTGRYRLSWWSEDAKVVKPASFLLMQELRLKIKHGHKPRFGGLHQKRLKS